MSDNYLTMARIMEKEWVKYRNAHKSYSTFTAMEQIQEKSAFQAGFMAGFSGKYFNTEE